MKYEIKNATAIYTGGNIYIYYGELTDGSWFRACDGEEFITICNADTSTEEADYYEFYEEHSVETLTKEEYETFWNKMLLWVIHNAPDGNYNTYELEKRMIENTKEEGYRTIKLTCGSFEEFEIIFTNATDSAIKADIVYFHSKQEEGEQIYKPYEIIELLGYTVNFLADQNDISEEELNEIIIDAEFDYYTKY